MNTTPQLRADTLSEEHPPGSPVSSPASRASFFIWCLCYLRPRIMITTFAGINSLSQFRKETLGPKPWVRLSFWTKVGLADFTRWHCRRFPPRHSLSASGDACCERSDAFRRSPACGPRDRASHCWGLENPSAFGALERHMNTNRKCHDQMVLDRDWLLFIAVVGLCIALASTRIAMALI